MFCNMFFMKNAFRKNIKLPLKISRLACKKHKNPNPPSAMMWRGKTVASHFDNAPQNLVGGWGWKVFFMFFACEA